MTDELAKALRALADAQARLVERDEAVSQERHFRAESEERLKTRLAACEQELATARAAVLDGARAHARLARAEEALRRIQGTEDLSLGQAIADAYFNPGKWDPEVVGESE